EKLKKKIDAGYGIEYWEFLEKKDRLVEKLGEKIDGSVEKNVLIEGKIVLGKNSVIKSGSVIEENTFIGKNCKIGPNAYLRANAVVLDNCHVGTSEVKNSIIFSNSNAPHFNYVGDSILGENVNLGAGTKIANLRHDNGTVKVKINGAIIDSGKRKLGALVGSNTKTGVNSSINCGAIVPNNSKILPNEFFK
ncbi:MAG: glucose-1-phosphate thymidylyltransferase, partial [Candidatus Diapherotrites archaeon]|nr:glucose-1-phosphate thymidylyltransferase [Candidatus Diapherotrites archaeon]